MPELPLKPLSEKPPRSRILVRQLRGVSGIYQAQCYDATELAGGVECRQFLTWFEGGVQYDVSTFFPASVSRDTVFAMAESMR